VSEKMLDNPTLYVVHTWSNSFVETVTAVQEYVHQVSVELLREAAATVQSHMNQESVWVWCRV